LTGLSFRRKWVQDDGFRFFQREGDTAVWREHGQDGKAGNPFKHVRETADFVDIADDRRNMVIRLRGTLCEWTNKDTDDAWNFMGHGRWEQTPTPLADFAYEVAQQESYVTAYGGKESNVIVPALILGKPVVALAGGGCFKDRSDLVSVGIPITVRSIGPMTFYGCTKLQSVSLPPVLESVGYNAFQGCSSLQEVRIPASVKKIEHAAFIRCQQMSDIVVDKENASYASVDGVLYDKEVTMLITCPAGKKGVLRIPPSVKGIESYAHRWMRTVGTHSCARDDHRNK